MTDDDFDDVGSEKNLDGLDLDFADDESSADDAATEELAAEAADIDAEAEAINADEDAAGDDVSEDARDAAGETDSGEAVGDEADELAGTELSGFDSAEIEDVEQLAPEQIAAIVEAALFATDKPLSLALIKAVFKGTQVRSKDLREALTTLAAEYASGSRGFTLEEVAGGYQLRTKPELMKYLRQSAKARPFKLSGPALEVLSIVAYKQPTTKSQIDEIRGVESGHLLRALMEKHLLTFGERSDLPGKPMFYETTKKFLEIFSLRNLGELPSPAEIDQLIPEGIGEVEDKETLSDLTGTLSKEAAASYSEGEDELLKITDELTQISTSSDFFEEEKRRDRERRDFERARDLREALTVGETIADKDQRWLERYDQAQAEASVAEGEVDFVTADLGATEAEPSVDASAVESPAVDALDTADATAGATQDAPPSRGPEPDAEV